MAHGHFEGKDLSHPELRKYFDREFVIRSDWYKARLKLKQQKDIIYLKTQIQSCFVPIRPNNKFPVEILTQFRMA